MGCQRSAADGQQLKGFRSVVGALGGASSPALSPREGVRTCLGRWFQCNYASPLHWSEWEEAASKINGQQCPRLDEPRIHTCGRLHVGVVGSRFAAATAIATTAARAVSPIRLLLECAEDLQNGHGGQSNGSSFEAGMPRRVTGLTARAHLLEPSSPLPLRVARHIFGKIPRRKPVRCCSAHSA